MIMIRINDKPGGHSGWSARRAVGTLKGSVAYIFAVSVSTAERASPGVAQPLLRMRWK